MMVKKWVPTMSIKFKKNITESMITETWRHATSPLAWGNMDHSGTFARLSNCNINCWLYIFVLFYPGEHQFVNIKCCSLFKIDWLKKLNRMWYSSKLLGFKNHIWLSMNLKRTIGSHIAHQTRALLLTFFWTYSMIWRQRLMSLSETPKITRTSTVTHSQW